MVLTAGIKQPAQANPTNGMIDGNHAVYIPSYLYAQTPAAGDKPGLHPDRQHGQHDKWNRQDANP